MANMLKIDELSYVPSENPEWFSRAMFGSKLITSGLVRVLMGIKGDELLNQIDIENEVLQLDGKDCAWTPNQILKLSEKKASVETYKINLEQCIDVLENKRTNLLLSPGAQNEELPDEFEDAALYLIAMAVSNEIEVMFFGGDKSVNPNHIDGLRKILLNSPIAAKRKGAVLTVDNVLDEFMAAYLMVPEEVLRAEEAGTLRCFTTWGAARLLRLALAKVPNDNFNIAQNFYINRDDPKNVEVRIFDTVLTPVKGLGPSDIIFADSNNLLLLTDLTSDLENIEIGPFAKPHENKVWIKGRLRLGIAVPFEDEAVISSPDVVTELSYTNPNGDLIIRPNNLNFAAIGESKTFTVITRDEDAEISLSANPDGYTVTKGATADGVTTVTVVASNNTGNVGPRVGQVIVTITGTDRSASVMLATRMEDVLQTVA